MSMMSKSKYRKLAEDIFFELLSRAENSLDEYQIVIERFEELKNNYKVMHEIVKNLKPKAKESDIEGIIIAFREAFENQHFENLESEFGT